MCERQTSDAGGGGGGGGHGDGKLKFGQSSTACDDANTSPSGGSGGNALSSIAASGQEGAQGFPRFQLCKGFIGPCCLPAARHT